MKLLSTLITALALIASVFTAPKAMAQDINIVGTSGSALILPEGFFRFDISDNENEVHICFVPTTEGVFAGHFTYDYNVDGTECPAANSEMGEWQDWEDYIDDYDITITSTDNDVNGEWSITGSGHYSDSNWNQYSFTVSYTHTPDSGNGGDDDDDDDEPVVVPGTIDPNFVAGRTMHFTSARVPYFEEYKEYYITLDDDLNNQFVIEVVTGTADNFVGIYKAHSIWSKTGEEFVDLDIKLSGDPEDEFDIYGQGILDDDTKVEFYYYSVPSEDITISSAGYATYYNPTKAVKLSEFASAYVASVDNSGNLHFDEEYVGNDIVPANTPVVIKGTGTETLEYTVGGVAPAHTNHLKGAASDMTADDMIAANGDCYFYAMAISKISKDPKSVGFYWLNEGGAAFNLGAGKAYLPVSKSQGGLAREGYAFDEAVAITKVNAEEKAAPIYNLQGLRVSEAKGLVVREGKMQFVK